MKNLTATKKIFVTMILLNVIIFGVYGYIYWNIAQESKTIAELQVQSSEYQAKNDDLRSVKISLDENKDFISQIDTFFIAKDGVVSFINTLERLGQSTGLKINIQSVSVEPGSDPKDFKEGLKLKIETEGGWQDSSRFLSIIENLPYRLVVNSASVILNGSSEAILFKDGEFNRKVGPEEVWKWTFDITVIKLK